MKEQDTGMDQNEAVNSVCSRRRCTHETVSRKDLAFGLCCAIQDAEHRQKAYSRSMLTKTPAPWPGSLCRRYAPCPTKHIALDGKQEGVDRMKTMPSPISKDGQCLVFGD